MVDSNNNNSELGELSLKGVDETIFDVCSLLFLSQFILLSENFMFFSATVIIIITIIIITIVMVIVPIDSIKSIVI